MCSKLSLLASLSLLLTLHTTTSFAHSTQLINKVCSQATNPPSCFEILESAPGAATANLTGLCQITIKMADSIANQTLQQLQSRVAKETDPQLKDSYETCAKLYFLAETVIQNLENDLKAGDYNSLNSHAVEAMHLVEYCRDSGNYSKFDVSIKQANDKVQHVVDITGVISDIFLG